MRKALLVILFMALAFLSRAQKKIIEVDSSQIVCDTIYRDSLFNISSIAFLPDSLIHDTLLYEFSKIKRFAYKSNLTKELYKLIFINPKPNTVNVMRIENPENRFTPFEGKIIKNISFKILRPYGYNILDTTTIENLGWLEKTANKLHTQTSERTLRKRMTIQPGMTVNPFEIVQNEILLRNLGYINDVYIFAESDESTPEQVNLIVICQDDFSWGADIHTNVWNSFRISASNKNFIHNGHYIKYEFGYYGNKDHKYGNTIAYNINSIYGTHFDINAHYNNDYKSKTAYITLDKQFLTNTIKWAGGLGIYRMFRTSDYPGVSPQYYGEPFNYLANECWIGRSFQLNRKCDATQNFYLTGKFQKIRFVKRPETSIDSNQFYYNRQFALTTLSFQLLKYYRANLIYDFGRTEIIPHGILSEFLTGYEKNEYSESIYLGHQIKTAFFNTQKNRYYGLNAGIGGYIKNNKLYRGVINLNYHHVSQLFNIGRHKIRIYDDISYMKGIRRYPIDYLYLTDTDITGFESDSLIGMQKLVLSLSSTLFFPHIYRGFRTSLTSYFDLGLLAKHDSELLTNKPYWGVGLAVNFRNDNIIFKRISIRFTYYPRIPPDMSRYEIALGSRRGDSFYDFQIQKPKVIPYK